MYRSPACLVDSGQQRRLCCRGGLHRRSRENRQRHNPDQTQPRSSSHLGAGRTISARQRHHVQWLFLIGRGRRDHLGVRRLSRSHDAGGRRGRFHEVPGRQAEEGLVSYILDGQTFDLDAVRSLKARRGEDPSINANPHRPFSLRRPLLGLASHPNWLAKLSEWIGRESAEMAELDPRNL